MYNQNFVFNGLGTLSVTIPVAGTYTFAGKTSLPTLTNGGGVSSVVTVVSQNSSPVYTGGAGAEGFSVVISCALNDVIAMAFSSSATPDQGLNVIKTVISIG